MENKKLYLTIFFSLVLGICIFSFIWSWWVTREIREDTEKAVNQGQKVAVKNLVLTETKDGQKYWELYAKGGDYSSSEGLVILDEIIGNFYDKNQEVVLSFHSPKGYYIESEKTIKLEGDTLLVAKDGSSISANEFVWKGQDEDITAEGNVIINRNDELVTNSEKAVFNSELTYFKIMGKSSTKIYDKSSETPLEKK